MKRIFITHILPEELVAKYKLSFAACNFSRNLIGGKGFDKVYTTMPVYVSGPLSIDDNDCELVYSRLRNKGGLYARLATFAEQWDLFKRIPCKSNIWLYNISVLNVFLYFLLRLFKRSVNIYVIELDFTPPTRKLSTMGLFLWIMNHSKGIIKLADSPLFTNHNAVCLAGVTPNEANYPLVENPKLEFLLSGVLQPNISSIPMILDAFAKVPECTLHITGVWDNMDIMNSYTQKHSNIIYHGVLPYTEYQNLLHSVTFQLSLRNPDWADNTCNFPSKIIEALVHNRGIVSTIQYSQLDGIEYITTKRSVDGFVATWKKISEMSTEKLCGLVNQGNKIKELFSVEVWNKSMSEIESK